MKVLNIHERVLNAPMALVGKLIDGLASPDDKLWPHDRWSPMKFDRPLSSGARGGHGPIRYFVEAYEPGRKIRFRFMGPKDFLGTHEFEIEELTQDKTKLRHVIDMRVKGWTRLQWLLVIRPLHDALLEDALDRAELFCGMQPAPRHWSLWVRLLRKVLLRKPAK
ncbi:MAG: SRPBCC family protein [Desulfobacteraceae bacterium]|nr:MAG: SRPBCC family protein [Desulfobacteraceae bacterium]